MMAITIRCQLNHKLDDVGHLGDMTFFIPIGDAEMSEGGRCCFATIASQNVAITAPFSRNLLENITCIARIPFGK